MIRKYSPTSPGRRGKSRMVSEASASKTTKSVRKHLTVDLKKQSGRSGGRISVQHKSNGAKKRYRIVDFKRNKFDIIGKVEALDYDPYRACDLALILYPDGERRYILRPENVNIGDTVVSGTEVEVKNGNTMPLGNIPLGTPVHNIELYPNAGGKFIRSAGAAGAITAKEGKYVNIKMPSGEVRRFLAVCYATIGRLGNDEFKLVKLGKAGSNRHKGVRPTTRGKTRSIGHPLAGKYKRRMGRHPVDQWGNLSKGKKTRKRTHTSKYIVKDRRSK
jgi:large subunit ribosomal protein L2